MQLVGKGPLTTDQAAAGTELLDQRVVVAEHQLAVVDQPLHDRLVSLPADLAAEPGAVGAVHELVAPTRPQGGM